MHTPPPASAKTLGTTFPSDWHFLHHPHSQPRDSEHKPPSETANSLRDPKVNGCSTTKQTPKGTCGKRRIGVKPELLRAFSVTSTLLLQA